MSGYDIYVSPDGNDSGQGTITDPFETLARACEWAQPGSTVYLREGEYNEALAPTTSGTVDSPITFSSYADETVVLVSGQRISNWTALGNGVYRADSSVDLGQGFNQLVCDGDLMIEARYPNVNAKEDLAFVFKTKNVLPTAFHQLSTSYDETDTVEIYEGGAFAQTDGEAWYVGAHNEAWGTQVARFEYIDSTTLGLLDKTASRCFDGGGDGYVVGAVEYLDHPREWFLDSDTGELYFIPPTGVDPNSATIYLKDRQAAIDLSDKQHIVVDGLNTWMGTVKMEHSENCVIRNSSHLYGGQHIFVDDIVASSRDTQNTQWDATGIFVSGSNNLIERCEVAYNAGASIMVTGEDHTVTNCRIHDSGLLGNYASGIFFVNDTNGEQMGGHEVAFNTIYTVGRSGIHMASDGSWGDPGVYPNPLSIHHNELANAMVIADDGGAVYCFSTDGNGTQIAYNLVHDGYSSGIYLDNYARGFDVHHNVVYRMDGNHIRVNSPNERVYVYNNTVFDAGYFGMTPFAGCYPEGVLLCDNIATEKGIHPKAIDFVATGEGGIQFQPSVASQVPQGYCDGAGQDEHSRLNYSGAYAPVGVEPAWQAGADWGGPIPPMPDATKHPLWLGESSQMSGFRNNAGNAVCESASAWIRYNDIDFGQGYSQLFFRSIVEAQHAGGTVEVRIGSVNGTLLGSRSLVANSDSDEFEVRCVELDEVSGVHDLYLVCNGAPGIILLDAFLLGPQGQMSRLLDNADGWRTLTMLESTFRKGMWFLDNKIRRTLPGDWLYFPHVDFGILCNRATVTLSLADGAEGGVIEFRSGTLDGPLLGEHGVTGTGDTLGDIYEEQEFALDNVFGVHDLFMVFKNADCGMIQNIRLLPETSVVSSFTGGDVGEGLNLSGDYVYALDIAGQSDSTLQGQVFSPSTGAAGVTITQGGRTVLGNWTTSPEYGISDNDNTLESIMHATALSWGEGKYIEIDLDVVAGVDYELQLFFSENDKTSANARRFNIAVEGEPIAEEFTPGPVAWSNAPYLGVLVTYRFTAGDGVLDIDLTPWTSGDTSPVIQGLTLKEMDEQTSAYDQWVASFLPVVIGSETDDYDGDLKENFYEYVCNGDPTNPAVTGMAPIFEFSDAGLLLIYAQRADDASLNYELEACTNLISGSWTNLDYVVLGTNDNGGAFNEVTNRIPTTKSEHFIRLKVTQ